jgi:transcriptional regulator with XRE-family HTH domain
MQTMFVLIDKQDGQRHKRAVPSKVEPVYAYFGNEIGKLRDLRQLTQEQLGAKLSPPLKRASIANIEGGKQRVLLHTVLQLARALDTEVSDLVAALERPTIGTSALEAELEEKLAAMNPAKRRELVEKLSGRIEK